MHILFDIGGTKTRVSFSSDGVSFEEPVIFPTPENPEDAVRLIAERVSERGRVSSGAGGVAGTLMRDGSLLSAPNLPRFSGFPLRDTLSQRLGVSVGVYNDAVLAGIAEARSGDYDRYPIIAYLTVGTGFGGAKIVGGSPADGMHNPEPGKQLMLTVEGVATVEERVSGAAVQRETGRSPETITDSDFWSLKTELFYFAVHNAVSLWAPDIIILGGSMTVTDGDGRVGISTETVGRLLEERLTFRPAPSVRRTRFGDFGVLQGALSVVE